MLLKINYGTQDIEFQVVRNNKNKNSYVTVSNDGVVVKTNDFTTIEEIKKLVSSKSKWIVQKLDEIKTTIKDSEIVTGSRLYYMGKNYYVQVHKEDRKNIKVEFNYSKFTITTPFEVSQDEIKEKIEQFYKSKCIEKITPIIEKCSEKMKLFPTKVQFRKSKTRWGSCNKNDSISFNYHLIKLSTSLIEYVVVHELSHIQHKNHSKEYWNLVRKYILDFDYRVEKIKQFEKLI